MMMMMMMVMVMVMTVTCTEERTQSCIMPASRDVVTSKTCLARTRNSSRNLKHSASTSSHHTISSHPIPSLDRVRSNYVARIFRGWVRPGVDPGFLVRGKGDRGAEGPERGVGSCFKII